jgi:hypothetical protein
MRWKAFRRPPPDAMRCDAGVGGLWALDGNPRGAEGWASERASDGRD